jgi:hypothetical protein
MVADRSRLIAVVATVYFLVEPTRWPNASDGFHERSVERGQVLFANKQSRAYESRSRCSARTATASTARAAAQFVLQPRPTSA